MESSVKEVSERLGVRTKTLYGWRQESRLEGGPQAMHSDLEKQNRDLRKENDELIFRWIECDYNTVRPHSGNEGDLPPLEKRRAYNARKAAA